MTQTRLGSLLETFANTTIGLIVSYVANVTVLPAVLHTTVSPSQAVWIGVAFTAISMLRGYLLRRLFNKIKGL